MKNDLYTGSGSSLAGSGSSAASSSSASSMQTSLLPAGGVGGAAGNSLSALSGGASGGKGSLAIGKSMFYTERPPNEYAASAMGECKILLSQ